VLLARQGGGEPQQPVPLEVANASMYHELSGLLLLRLCNVGLAASWLSRVPGPMAKLAAGAAGVVSCWPVPADGATRGASAGITLGTSSRLGLGVFARHVRLATLASCDRLSWKKTPLLDRHPTAPE
jgi:hypothetical protein